jgi:hypothetical protein
MVGYDRRSRRQSERLTEPVMDFIDVGPPFGAKPWLIPCHLNAEAPRTWSPSLAL